MLTSILSRGRFLRTQEAFYQEVTRSPVQCNLKVSSAIVEDSLNTFLGSSERTFENYTINCLFKRDIAKSIRSKYGLSENAESVVYLAPKQLLEITGKDKLDANKTTIQLLGLDYGIDKVLYLEPLYDTCISILVSLTSNIRGT